MKFGVVVFPGSNCDHDTYHVISKVIGQPVEFIWHKEEEIDRFDAIILPGGFGTMDEFFEVATLIQTGKMLQVPLILVSSSYWSGLIDWMKETMLKQANNISPVDLDLLKGQLRAGFVTA